MKTIARFSYSIHESFSIVTIFYLTVLNFIAELTSLGASLLSPILRSSDSESIKSDTDAPASKRRRLSVSSQEVLEQLAQEVQRSSPAPARPAPGRHPASPPRPHYQASGPYTRRQRNLSNRWGERGPARRSPPLTRRSHRHHRDRREPQVSNTALTGNSS